MTRMITDDQQIAPENYAECESGPARKPARFRFALDSYRYRAIHPPPTTRSS